MKRCKVCKRKHYAKGYCKRHHQQFLKHGKIINTEPVIRTKICKECSEKHYALGYCEQHYHQFNRYGKIGKIINKNMGNDKWKELNKLEKEYNKKIK